MTLFLEDDPIESYTSLADNLIALSKLHFEAWNLNDNFHTSRLNTIQLDHPAGPKCVQLG